MISEISPIVDFVTILKTAWCVISCIGFTEIQRSRNMSKYMPLCYSSIQRSGNMSKYMPICYVTLYLRCDF
jgi:hypothetical protein